MWFPRGGAQRPVVDAQRPVVELGPQRPELGPQRAPRTPIAPVSDFLGILPPVALDFFIIHYFEIVGSFKWGTQLLVVWQNNENTMRMQCLIFRA